MMTTLTLVAACFLAGLFQDALSTALTRCVADREPIPSGILSVVITLVSYLLFAAIYHAMTSGDYYLLLSYATGGGLGTYIVVAFKRKIK